MSHDRTARALAGHDRDVPGDDAGFSLVEVVVAMTIFVVLAVTVLGVLLTSLGGVRSNAQRVQAANLAAQQIEAVRSQRAQDVPDGTVAGSTSGTTVEGTTYTVTQTADFYTSDQKQSICDSSSDTPAFKRVSVAVTWPGMEPVKPVRTTTVISVGLGDAGLSTGLVAVSVLDSTPAPVRNLAVSLDSGATSTTDDQGCAVFTNVPEGGYRAVLDASGRVGVNGQQRYTSPTLLAVQPSKISRDTVQYDRPGRLSVAWSYPAGFRLPDGDGLPVSLQYALAEPAGPRPAVACGPGGPAAGQHCIGGPAQGPRETSPLYPANYQAWAGLCQDSRPDSPPALNLVSGGSQGIIVPLASFELVPGSSKSPSYAGYGVSFSHDADSRCGQTTLTFPAVPADGRLRISLPAGSWRLRLDNPRGGSASGTFTLTADQITRVPT